MAVEILIYIVDAILTIAAAFGIWFCILFGYELWKESALKDDIQRKRRTDD